MNSEPPTGDDLTRMLVSMKQDVLARAEPREAPARRRRIHPGLIVGIVAFLGLGAASGGIALGMVPSPFSASAPEAPAPTSAAPAPTPTPAAPTPEPTPTATRAAAPSSTVPIGCDAILTRAGLDRLDPSMATFPRTYEVPSTATLATAGVLSCLYNADPEGTGPTLALSISSDADAGRQRVEEVRGSGLPSLGVGDASGGQCDTMLGPCTLTMVAGSFWVEASYAEAQNLTGVPPELTAVLRSLAATLSPLTPEEKWDAPPTMWSSVTSCGDFREAIPLKDILQAPSLGAPAPLGTDAGDGISLSNHSVLCGWDTRADAAAPLAQMTADLSIDGAWQLDALQSTDQAGTPIKVEGADAAYTTCGKGDGAVCWLDVSTDGSWLQVGAGSNLFEKDIPTMVRVAASLIAGTAAEG